MAFFNVFTRVGEDPSVSKGGGREGGGKGSFIWFLPFVAIFF